MKIPENQLKEAFENYYKEKGVSATHVFVYSKTQESIISKNILMFFHKERVVFYVNNKNYSEMRSRDSADKEFGFDDTMFVCVGTNSDINQ